MSTTSTPPTPATEQEKSSIHICLSEEQRAALEQKWQTESPGLTFDEFLDLAVKQALQTLADRRRKEKD